MQVGEEEGVDIVMCILGRGGGVNIVRVWGGEEKGEDIVRVIGCREGRICFCDGYVVERRRN
jgi:hypothetical protein